MYVEPTVIIFRICEKPGITPFTGNVAGSPRSIEEGQVITHSDSAKGEKPITMIFTLKNRVPDDIYQELTDVVKIPKE